MALVQPFPEVAVARNPLSGQKPREHKQARNESPQNQSDFQDFIPCHGLSSRGNTRIEKIR